MLIDILLIYSIILCFYFRTRLVGRISIKITNYLNLAYNLIVVFLFFMLFFIFLRILNLFRDKNVFDLNIVLETKLNVATIILLLVFGYCLRNLLFFYVKLCWYRLHYFFLSNHNLPNISRIYTKYIFYVIFKSAVKSYYYFIFFNIVMSIALIIIMLHDILMNNLILNNSLVFLCYYSAFKIFYIFTKFLATKLELNSDFWLYNHIYPGIIEDNPFFEYSLEKNRIAIRAVLYYKEVILEDYIFSKKKNLDSYVFNSKEFFKNINQVRK